MCASVNRTDPIVDMNERIWSAVWKNDLETLRGLLQRTSKEAINYKHDSGKTALHTAALNIHLDCAKMLIGMCNVITVVNGDDNLSHTNRAFDLLEELPPGVLQSYLYGKMCSDKNLYFQGLEGIFFTFLCTQP